MQVTAFHLITLTFDNQFVVLLTFVVVGFNTIFNTIYYLLFLILFTILQILREGVDVCANTDFWLELQVLTSHHKIFFLFTEKE